jgi:hypothetical protein
MVNAPFQLTAINLSAYFPGYPFDDVLVTLFFSFAIPAARATSL